MPLDPQARALVELWATTAQPKTETLSPSEARRALEVRQALTGVGAEPVGGVEDRTIPGPGGPLRIRIYRPSAPPPRPLLVFFHGGGWVLGNLDTNDALCRALTNAARCLVVSVDYRLAPEHKFPAAVEDAYAAVCWAADAGASVGGDPSRLAVAGSSAGGNLAAVAALLARDRGGPRLAYQLLLYPITNYDFETASYRAYAEGFGLTRAEMQWFWRHYLNDEREGAHPYASPLRAEDLSGLPPACVITAGYDVLRDEGLAYAERLRAAGVPVASWHYPGMVHAFVGNANVLDAGKSAIAAIGQALRAALGS